jgi:hypothetical protein
MTADAFFTVTGQVVTGCVAGVPAHPGQLLALPDHRLSVLIAHLPGFPLPQVTLRNHTGSALAAVRAQGADAAPVSLALAPGDTILPWAMPDGGLDLILLQVLPAGPAFDQVVTIVVALDTGDGGPAAVGQAVTERV